MKHPEVGEDYNNYLVQHKRLTADSRWGNTGKRSRKRIELKGYTDGNILSSKIDDCIELWRIIRVAQKCGWTSEHGETTKQKDK